MQQQSSPVQYAEPLNAPALIPVLASATYKEEIRETPAGALYIDGPS